MLRERAYGRKGERIRVLSNKQLRSKRISYIAFLGMKGWILFDRIVGSHCVATFLSSVRTLLASGAVIPHTKNHIWVLDNCSIHTSPKTIAFLKKNGIYPFFLPTYCPFLTPVENGFSVIKKILKRTSPSEITDAYGLCRQTDLAFFSKSDVCAYNPKPHYSQTNWIHKTVHAIGYREDGYYRSKTTQKVLDLKEDDPPFSFPHEGIEYWVSDENGILHLE
ncbi:hypothetical protein ADUPG1_005434 [Aduncisulcus paluster]|uniref:Tc1-like transposase DDE domain-containing protein n=1 Tax=Aduncisulcus paluster TaxID=2918883 RepID=A0ABQ5KCC5_9EUKA|nr:hypothetical protein ADUPG1_005434 [Aduncisulcus paluster]